MEWNGHNRIGLTEEITRRTADPTGKKGSQINAVGMLELQNQVPRGLIIEACSPGSTEGSRFGHAGGAPDTYTLTKLKRRSAAMADGVVEKSDLVPGFNREPCRKGSWSFVQRLRRKEDVQQSPTDR